MLEVQCSRRLSSRRSFDSGSTLSNSAAGSDYQREGDLDNQRPSFLSRGLSSLNNFITINNSTGVTIGDSINNTFHNYFIKGES